MKKLFIASLTLLLTLSIASAQETDKKKVKEVGMTLNSFNNFGFTYRLGNQNSVWRFSSFWLNGRHSKSENFGQTNEQRSIGASLAVGKEFRKPVNDKLEFRYGTELFASYTENMYDYRNTATPYYGNSYQFNKSVGLNFVFGFNYLINENFVAGLELTPGVSYFRNDFENNVNDQYEDGISWGFNQNFAALSLILRFD